ncbi:TPA: helix-turn-helix domain-containing protein, partial [Escherichia coli]
IPFHKLGRKVLYMRTDLDAYLASTRRTQTV